MNQTASSQAELNRVDMLIKHPLTRDLSEKDLLSIHGMFHAKSVPPATNIIHEGSTPSSVYLIIDGGVRVFVTTPDGKEITLSFLGQFEILGELAYLDKSTRSASVQTFKETQLLVICGEDFKKIVERFPCVAINLLNILAKRIRHTHQQLKDLVASSLMDRTYKALSVLEKYFPEGEISLSHEELALILGATRPRVTEVLHSLKRLKKLDFKRQKIRFSPTFPEEQT